MADIFLSYANEDRDRAARLANVLGARGWTVWWDRKIVAGHQFDQVIERELDAAKCVVVLWSASSVTSEWVKNEAAVAAEKGVLVPALIDPVKLPLEFRRRQTVDLAGWDGDPSDEGLKSLVEGISSLAGAATAAAGGPSAASDGPIDRPPRESGARPPRSGLMTGITLMVDRMIALDQRALQIQFALGAVVLAIGVAVTVFGFFRLRAGGSELYILVMLAGAVMGVAGFLPFSGCLTRWQRIGVLRTIQLSADQLGDAAVSNIVMSMYAK